MEQKFTRIVEIPITPDQQSLLGVSQDSTDAEIARTVNDYLNRDAASFGVVRWCDEDIEDALEEAGVPNTEENVAAIRAKCEHHAFADAQIETGLNYINAYVAEVFRK